MRWCYASRVSSLQARTALGIGMLALAAGTAHVASAAGGLSIGHLRCEYKENPLGIGTLHPRLSWQVASPARGQRQTAYQDLGCR